MDNQQAGAQSLRRALSLLRIVAQNNDQGISLSDLIDVGGLKRSTTHRLMSSLVEENFVWRNDQTKCYHLGIDAMQLGFSSMSYIPLLDELRPLAMRLSRLSEDTVFVVVQQGDYGICLLREHGSFPVRIFTINVGEKRLLGIGAGGLALLSMYNDHEIKVLYERHKEEYLKANISLDILLKKCHATRKLGFSFIDSTITTGVSGVGYAFSVSEITRIAVSFGAISPRLDDVRRIEMGKLLIAESNLWLEQRNK